MSTSSHDRSEIAAIAEQVAGSADRATTDRDTVQQGIRDQEGCFGSDAAARSFLAGYAAAARSVLENDAQIPTQLDAIGQRLGEMGGTYTQGEQDAVDLGGAVDQELQA